MIDFDIAKAWHKIFALHVEFVIEGIEKTILDPRTVGDDTVCDLGHWIFGPGRRYANSSAYNALVETHIRFHYAASSILVEHLAGKAITQLALFRAASEAVLASIDALASSAATDASPVAADASTPGRGGRAEPVWQESMRIGMKLIDEQHQELLIWIEKLNDEPTAAITAKPFVASMSAVKRLAALHFETEEMFMQRAGFPLDQMAQHVCEHARLLDLLVAAGLDGGAGLRRTAAEAYRTIADEVLGHIVKFDLPLRTLVTNPRTAKAGGS